MKTLTVRGIDGEVQKGLENLARREGISVNSAVVRTLRAALGLDKKRRTKQYHDLDHLAGTWTAVDGEEFQKNTACFEKIDEAIWK
ncbi:MAG: hypothetical protein ABSC02_14450 [Acidobacteriota bacterium]|jgi:hypothetical protein